MSTDPAIRYACAACGATPPSPFAWRCPNAGSDDADHRMARTLDTGRVGFPADGETDPFLRFRELSHAWQVARSAGMPDEDFAGRVRRLQERVATVDCRGFAATPFAPAPALGERLGFARPGALWIKDETRNVSGSHKGRHLMGLALELEVAEWLEPAARAVHERHGLAIASCGNAALAAAVVARAAERQLEVFIPPDAEPSVVARLHALGSRVRVCDRVEGGRGDPTLTAFRDAVAAGAVPFCCQASENGHTLEGGQTLAWEIVATLRAAGATLDRLFVQVGGGALLSSCVQSLREAVALGALPALPRLHAVQTEGAHPLDRAYRLVRERILERLAATGARGQGAGDREAADLMQSARGGPEVAAALDYAIHHRSAFMWPWETPPRSIARGILDDETYDWPLAVSGMIESGGYPVVVDEETLRQATEMAVSATGIAVDATGAAGLAGAVALLRDGGIAPHERVAVLFTGARR